MRQQEQQKVHGHCSNVKVHNMVHGRDAGPVCLVASSLDGEFGCSPHDECPFCSAFSGVEYDTY